MAAALALTPPKVQRRPLQHPVRVDVWPLSLGKLLLLLIFIGDNPGGQTALNSGVLLSSCPKQTSRTPRTQSQAGCSSPPLRKTLPGASQMQMTCPLACSPSASRAGTGSGAPRTQIPQPRAAHTPVSARNESAGRGAGEGAHGWRAEMPQQQLFLPLRVPHHRTRTTWSCAARAGNAGCERAGRMGMVAHNGRHSPSLTPPDTQELSACTGVAPREVPEVSASCRGGDPDKPPWWPGLSQR